MSSKLVAIEDPTIVKLWTEEAQFSSSGATITDTTYSSPVKIRAFRMAGLDGGKPTKDDTSLKFMATLF